MVIKVITLNCWGVPVAAKKVKERALYLAEHLNESLVDVVGLQEVFQQWHAELLIEQCKVEYPYSHWTRNGSLGSPGLLLLSKYPIVSVQFLEMRLNGYPQEILKGDFVVGKGVTKTRIVHPDSIIDVYNTHLHANYDSSSDTDPTEGHRLCQHYDLANYVNQSVPVILLGDMNTLETEVSTALFKELSGLTDSYRELYAGASENPGYTSGTAETDWKNTGGNSESNFRRLDYIYYNKDYLHCTMSGLCCGTVPGGIISYSDHLGVRAEFEVTNPVVQPFSRATTFETISKSLQVITAFLDKEKSDKWWTILVLIVLVLIWLAVMVVGMLQLVSFGIYIAIPVSNILAVIVTVLLLYCFYFKADEISKYTEYVKQLTVLKNNI